MYDKGGGVTAMPEYGWKIHVTSEKRTHGEVMDRVIPLIMDEGPSFKVMGDASKIEGGSEESKGKSVVIYTDNPEQAKRLAERIDNELEGVPKGKAVNPKYDKLYRGKSGLVSYRFGLYKSGRVYVPGVGWLVYNPKRQIPAGVEDVIQG